MYHVLSLITCRVRLFYNTSLSHGFIYIGLAALSGEFFSTHWDGYPPCLLCQWGSHPLVHSCDCKHIVFTMIWLYTPVFALIIILMILPQIKHLEMTLDAIKIVDYHTLHKQEATLLVSGLWHGCAVLSSCCIVRAFFLILILLCSTTTLCPCHCTPA